MSDPTYQLIRNDGVSYEIPKIGLSLGRHRSNDVVISDPAVSRHHARCWFADDRYWIRDLNSKGGTFVNSQRVLGQQEFKPGETLQIGPATFRLEVVTVPTIAAPTKVRRNLLFLGGAAAVIVILIASLVARGSVFKMPVGLVQTTTSTQTETPPTPSRTPTITGSSTATVTPTPYIGATIHCEMLDQSRDTRPCTITNMGTKEDVLWLAFDPFLEQATNHFKLSVVLEGQTELTFPDRKGLISLGLFEPQSNKTITLQMICTDVVYGCSLTTIHVQLFAQDGVLAITGPNGEFDIQNAAVGQGMTPTATRRVAESKLTTTITVTNTPSDAVGPTETPGYPAPVTPGYP